MLSGRAIVLLTALAPLIALWLIGTVLELVGIEYRGVLFDAGGVASVLFAVCYIVYSLYKFLAAPGLQRRRNKKP